MCVFLCTQVSSNRIELYQFRFTCALSVEMSLAFIATALFCWVGRFWTFFIVTFARKVNPECVLEISGLGKCVSRKKFCASFAMKLCYIQLTTS